MRKVSVNMFIFSIQNWKNKEKQISFALQHYDTNKCNEEAFQM